MSQQPCESRNEDELNDFDFDVVSFHLDESGDFQVTDQVRTAWKRFGFFVVRNLLDTRTVEALDKCIHSDVIQESILHRVDRSGQRVNFSLWKNIDDGLCGAISRCEKVVEPFEHLLGGEVYHYHSKLVLKDQNGGGAFNWHQDYGYWYKNGCLSPEMGTLWIPVDHVDRTNGCLKVIPGSHLLGRVEHVLVNNQVSADPERVDVILQRYGLVFVEMGPGDALFFHANVLHSSDQNWSQKRRWAFLASYNPKWNNPVYKHHLPNYHPLEKLPNKHISDYLDKFGTRFEFLQKGVERSLTYGYGKADRVEL